MKKVISWLLVALLAIGMYPAALADEAAATVIDFEDGAYAFLGLSTAKGNADASVLSVEDFNGSKALKVTPQGKVPYVSLNVEGLLGDRLADLRAVSVDYAVATAEDGKFYAVSGKVYTTTGEDNAEKKHDWSVYLAKKNPYTVVTALAEGEVFAAGLGNTLTISRETDNHQTAKGAPLPFYLDNIKFLDAEGNALPLDLTAVYTEASSDRDLSNLSALLSPVEFPGFACSGDAWAQNGFEMPQEFLDALVPGSVIEVEYKSEDGAMWIVMPWAAAGWMRVANDGSAAINNSKNIAQITYEQIEALCGEDKSTWGAMLQCESSSAWEVYALRVGKRADQTVLTNAVEFPGFTCSAGAWAQNGFEMPQEFLDALVPGSVIEVEFKSEDGAMWIVMPWAAAGWMRVGNDGAAAIVGNKAYITYEQIAALCGEDKSTWGAMLQCESSSAWEVYSLRVGTAKQLKALTNLVALEGFDKSAGAWAQDGVEMTEAFLNALVPGSVITVNYESEDGSMWIVMPWAAAGWMRVGNDGQDVATGSVAQVTYEQIEAACGEDKTTWGAMLQCESSSNWHVYSVAVGTPVQ